MFFPERMKRIRFLVHESQKKNIIKGLHELGAVQISDYKEQIAQDEWIAVLNAHPISQDVRKITSQLMAIGRFLDVFSFIDPEEQESFFKKLFYPSPTKKITVDDVYGEELFEESDRIIQLVELEVSEPFENLERTEAEIANLKNVRSIFERIHSIDIPLEYIGDGPFVHVFAGIAPSADYASLVAELEVITEGVFFFSEKAVSQESICFVIACMHSCKDTVLGYIRKWDIERINPGNFTGSPRDAMKEIDEDIKAMENKYETLKNTLITASRKWRTKLQSLRELLLIERERAEIQSSFAKTEFVTAIQGWVPEEKAEVVSNEMVKNCNGLAVTEISEPEQPPEKLPVLLKNPGVLKHFELLTKLYAPPRYDEIDPTVLIFPSFLFFFGLMITDAMYGLMTFLVGYFILRGGGRYQPLFKSAGVLLTLGGLTTVILGAMTGGWFGNLASKYLGMHFLDKLIVLNPMVDVSQFLLFSLGVGLLHLNIGIVMGIIKDTRRRALTEAIKNVWIFFFEAFLVFYYFGLKIPALIFAVPALLLLLYSAKGMALFGITGLLGDTLSYARLMALGLVSFGLAVAINALAKMVFGVHYVGWLFALIILVVGHSFSWVLNLMGAFAHGIRLHFVEFFGKFYSGGGEEFSPFRIKRELTETRMKQF